MPNEEYQTIIVCIDTSNASLIALRYACLKAKKQNFEVKILAVIESSHKNFLFGSKTIADENRNTIEKNLHNIINKAYDGNDVKRSISIKEGEVYLEIIKEIKETKNCQMLILGKSNNALSDNTVLPNIIRKIGNKIKIPVVIIPESLSESYFKKLC